MNRNNILEFLIKIIRGNKLTSMSDIKITMETKFGEDGLGMGRIDIKKLLKYVKKERDIEIPFKEIKDFSLIGELVDRVLFEQRIF